MLPLVAATVLAALSIMFALAAGELRYEQPQYYPYHQRFAMTVASVLVVLAICVARYA